MLDSPPRRKRGTDSESCDSDDISFKRKKKFTRKICRQTIGISSVTKAKTSEGYLIQRNEAVIVNSVSLPNISSAQNPQIRSSTSSFSITTTQRPPKQ